MSLSALTTQLFKHLINAPRPITWFAANMPDISLPLTEGVRMNAWYSFPSGHTTSFFSLMFVASILLTQLISKENGTKAEKAEKAERGHCLLACYIIQVILFILAALGGYSRIYLSQHFAADVLAGIVVGVLITIVCYAILSRYEDKKWYNYRVFKKNEG